MNVLKLSRNINIKLITKMNFNRKNLGFTLIELLVVVAIIGILASVVLSSLNTARAKGADAAIKANLANIRAQAEILYDSNSPNSYAGICTGSTATGPALVVYNQMKAAADSLGGTVAAVNLVGTASTVVCHVDGNNANWAVSSGTKVTPADSWCVDSTGASMKIVTGFLPANDTTCN